METRSEKLSEVSRGPLLVDLDFTSTRNMVNVGPIRLFANPHHKIQFCKVDIKPKFLTQSELP